MVEKKSMIRLKVCIPLTECNWIKLSTLYNLYNYLQTRLCPPINFWILQTLILHHIFFYSSLNYFCVGFSFSFKDIYIFILMFQGYPKHAFDMNLLLVAVTFALRWSCEPIGGGGLLIIKKPPPWTFASFSYCCLAQIWKRNLLSHPEVYVRVLWHKFFCFCLLWFSC